MNKEKLVELKEAMTLEVKVKNKLNELQEEFEEDNRDLLSKHAKLREQILNCKQVLIENAEEGYKKDGEKKRLGGIGIKIMKLLNYDEAVALMWAKDKDLFLKLDKSAFDKVAKTGTLDFVTINEKVTVTFPKEIILGD